MSPSLAASLREVGVRRLLNMYGPTETTVWSTFHDVSGVDGSVPIGRPIANTFVRVASLGGSMAAPGVAGELLIGGPGVTRGYLNRPELTRERFVDVDDDQVGRMYRTGDLVRLNHRAELEFLGRGDTQVKVRGYRIELGEIESALARHPAVKEAVVVVYGDRPEDQRLIGYVTLRGDPSADAAALRDQLRSSLPEFMIPSQIVVLADFPRTPNGKTDRRHLPPPERAGVVRHASATAVTAGRSAKTPPPSPPTSTASPTAAELQRAITDIWCDVLHVEAVGPDENFFDVGGHSLLAVQVHQRVKAAAGRDFPITDLFRFSTVRALADHLAEASDSPNAAGRGTERAAMRRQATQRRR
jgi:acyl carrier protein